MPVQPGTVSKARPLVPPSFTGSEIDSAAAMPSVLTFITPRLLLASRRNVLPSLV